LGGGFRKYKHQKKNHSFFDGGGRTAIDGKGDQKVQRKKVTGKAIWLAVEGGRGKKKKGDKGCLGGRGELKPKTLVGNWEEKGHLG